MERRSIPGPGPAARGWTTGAANLEEDERRLRVGGPSTRAAALLDVSISYGVGVHGEPDYVARARAAALPVLRRSTGGTGVIHLPGDLTWSVVLPRTDPRVGRDYVQAYDRLGAGVVSFLAGHGVAAAWSPAPDLVADYCVLSGRGLVLAVGPRVLGGAAQHATANALLHQGMIARRVDDRVLDEIFGIREPSALDRLTGLEDLGISDPPEVLARQLGAALERELTADGSGAAGA
jgi:lipoate-protein ligase A